MFTQEVKGSGTKFDFQGVILIAENFKAERAVFGSKSNFAGMKLTGSTAKGVSFVGTVFEPGCNFKKTDFGEADLEGADFNENSLSGSILDLVKNLATAKGIQKKKDVEKMLFDHEMVRRPTHTSCLFLLIVQTAEPAKPVPTKSVPASAWAGMCPLSPPTFLRMSALSC